MSMGGNIRAARRAAGVTQVELAAKLGVNQKDVSRWEQGKQIPSADTLAKLCKCLDVSADNILGLKKGR
jgi:transcriptional regulator with XRE-family HTH domain